MHRELRTTADGSKTIFSPQFNENYHSIYGAMGESLHVYIENGLAAFTAFEELHILEIGFGTGLNALLTCLKKPPHQKVFYTGLEPYPVETALWQQLHYGQQEGATALFENIHQAGWGYGVGIAPNFVLTKLQTDLMVWEPAPAAFDLVYFDAFAPSAQTALWTTSVFEKTYHTLRAGGQLVTYCAKGAVKRNMKAAGFQIEGLPGPPGKREMTRATKPAS